MSMRALWFLLFVLAPLATLAGYGSTYGIGSAGGGVTVGNAVSGGTASRLLFSDAGGLVSTASPALGEALTLSGAATLQSTLDVQGNISNTGSATCFTGVTGVPCFSEGVGANGNFLANGAATTDSPGTLMYEQATNKAGVRWGGSAAGITGYRNKLVLYTTTSGNIVSVGTNANPAAGTGVFAVEDNYSGGTAQLLTVDGTGNLFLNASATRSKGTITLAAGTGTATVASGSVCVCSDTTAANAVQCSVSSTTLTANGTGTDVIAYHCF